MTTLALLGGDWEYQFEDERVTGAATNAGTKMLRYISGPVRTTNEVYSAYADAADEFQAMGFDNGMLPVTPNEYTMESQAFIARRSLEFLKEGTIISDGTITGTKGFIRKIYSASTVAPVAGDIGREVTETTSGDIGTLLDFETEPDGTTVLWIRPNDSTLDTFALATVITGTGTTMSVTGALVPTNGINRDIAIQAIGSVPTATEVYIIQDRIKLVSQSGGFQWWVTDVAVSLGIISVLVRTMRSSVAIADQDVEVFSRRYASLYDNFRLNVGAGGFSALPLASAPDINNTTGYRQITGSGGVNTFNVGNALYVGASFAAATKKGILTSVAGTVGAPILQYYLVGDQADFANTDALKEFDFTTQVDGDATATAAAPIAAPGGPTEAGATNGGSVTITAGHTTRNHDNLSTAEPYSVIIDAQSDVPIAKVYERIKYVTRRGATAADLFGGSANIGEQYRGLEAQIFYDTPVGDFTENEAIAGQLGYTARSVSDNSAAAGEGTGQAYLMVTDQQTSLDAVINNDVLTDTTGGDTVAVDTAGAGGAVQSIASVKASPFGTFTGTQIFGARGIDFRNPAGADVKAYILIDDNGIQRSPPNTISFTLTNLVSGDRVQVARDTGVAGVLDRDQFGGSHATLNILGDTAFQVAGTLDVEVPTAGFFKVVENALLEDHRYEYASRTTGAGGIFTLYAPTSGTGTITTAGVPTLGIATLTDLGQLFSSGGNPVKIGHLVRNTFAGKVTHVWEVVTVLSDTTLSLKQLYGPLNATQDWDIGDTYEINRLIQAYDAADDVFDLILDSEATGSSSVNTLIKTPAAPFGTVVQVRRGKSILPFEQNQTVNDVNVSVTAVRTPDTVAV